MMHIRLLKTVALLALTACSGLALADDPPARVGRVALAEGQVSIASDDQPPAAALVNWPVTSHQVITTAPGARTELRIGSTSVRLAGGSALEVDELDDEHLRLRLHYGSANIRIVNPDAAAGFELATPQARVRMREPGRLRVDAGRAPDTSVVNVFSGVAFVDGAGEELSVRAGRRAEVGDGDLRTGQALRDGFDDWAYARDQYQDRARSARYLTPEMTGYEDLDRYGSWRSDAEYGTLWVPSVGPSWVPYRDGSWVWVDPWGWTWVDNAPWGYAPFHYGRWVYVQRHWAWAPGRHDRHPVWSPALVGWVGGANWNVHFNGDGRRAMPAQGWYPLSPHERYVPTWHAPEQHLRWWNADVRRDGWHDRDDYRRGLTVVPHDAFTRRDRVPVAQAPKAAPAPLALQQAPAAAPPPPRERHDQRREDGPRRFDHDRFEHGQRPPVATAPPVRAAQPAPVQVLTAPSVAQPAPLPRGGDKGRLGGVVQQQFDEARRLQFEQQRRQQFEQEHRQQMEQDQRRQQAEQQHRQQMEQDQRRQQAEQQQRQQMELDQRRQQAEQQHRQQFEQQHRPAPAPAPLEAGPVPGPGEPGFVHHGERPRREEAERERRTNEPAAMPPQAARPVFVSPQSARAMAPPETARPLPLPPQARPATAPPETARPFPMPPQAAAHPVQGPPPQPHPRAPDEHPDHGRGDRNGRQQER